MYTRSMVSGIECCNNQRSSCSFVKEFWSFIPLFPFFNKSIGDFQDAFAWLTEGFGQDASAWVTERLTLAECKFLLEAITIYFR